MQTIINRNLLKYSAGRAIFCQCGQVADWKSWVIAERPDGSIAGNCCTACYDAAIGDKPLPSGYTIIRHGKARKAPAKPGHCDVPQKPGKGLNTWLRKAINAAHAKEDRLYKCKGDMRQFPKGFGTAPWPMQERLTVDAEDNGTVHVDYAGDPHFTPEQTAAYIAEFCRLNHLRG